MNVVENFTRSPFNDFSLRQKPARTRPYQYEPSISRAVSQERNVENSEKNVNSSKKTKQGHSKNKGSIFEAKNDRSPFTATTTPADSIEKKKLKAKQSVTIRQWTPMIGLKNFSSKQNLKSFAQLVKKATKKDGKMSMKEQIAGLDQDEVLDVDTLGYPISETTEHSASTFMPEYTLNKPSSSGMQNRDFLIKQLKSEDFSKGKHKGKSYIMFGGKIRHIYSVQGKIRKPRKRKVRRVFETGKSSEDVGGTGVERSSSSCDSLNVGTETLISGKARHMVMKSVKQTENISSSVNQQTMENATSTEDTDGTQRGRAHGGRGMLLQQGTGKMMAILSKHARYGIKPASVMLVRNLGTGPSLSLVDDSSKELETVKPAMNIDSSVVNISSETEHKHSFVESPKVQSDAEFSEKFKKVSQGSGNLSGCTCNITITKSPLADLHNTETPAVDLTDITRPKYIVQNTHIPSSPVSTDTVRMGGYVQEKQTNSGYCQHCCGTRLDKRLQNAAVQTDDLEDMTVKPTKDVCMGKSSSAFSKLGKRTLDVAETHQWDTSVQLNNDLCSAKSKSNTSEILKKADGPPLGKKTPLVNDACISKRLCSWNKITNVKIIDQTTEAIAGSLQLTSCASELLNDQTGVEDSFVTLSCQVEASSVSNQLMAIDKPGLSDNNGHTQVQPAVVSENRNAEEKLELIADDKQKKSMLRLKKRLEITAYVNPVTTRLRVRKNDGGKHKCSLKSPKARIRSAEDDQARTVINVSKKNEDQDATEMRDQINGHTSTDRTILSEQKIKWEMNRSQCPQHKSKELKRRLRIRSEDKKSIPGLGTSSRAVSEKTVPDVNQDTNQTETSHRDKPQMLADMLADMVDGNALWDKVTKSQNKNMSDVQFANGFIQHIDENQSVIPLCITLQLEKNKEDFTVPQSFEEELLSDIRAEVEDPFIMQLTSPDYVPELQNVQELSTSQSRDTDMTECFNFLTLQPGEPDDVSSLSDNQEKMIECPKFELLGPYGRFQPLSDYESESLYPSSSCSAQDDVHELQTNSVAMIPGRKLDCEFYISDSRDSKVLDPGNWDADSNMSIETVISDLTDQHKTVNKMNLSAGCPTTEKNSFERLPLCGYGDVVWARFSKIWWPGLIIKWSLANLCHPRHGYHWVFWFGDHLVSQIGQHSIEHFTVNFKKRLGTRSSQVFKTAVYEALQVCAERVGLNVAYGDRASIWQWGTQGFLMFSCRAFSPDKGRDFLKACPWPGLVLRELKKIAAPVDVSSSDTGDSSGSSCCEDEDEDDVSSSMTSSSDSDDQSEEEEMDQHNQSDTEPGFCISCYQGNCKTVCDHPVFQGKLCRACRKRVKERFYRLDKDGCSRFCCICALGGELFVCDNPDCRRSYCRQCMSRYLPDNILVQIQNMDPWQCFLCLPPAPEAQGYLRPHQDWKERLISFFSTVLVNDLSYFSAAAKRSIRVLSLFDGIGTGKLLLDQLGLEVEVYYASEIDSDAMSVSEFNHGTSIKRVGDVKYLQGSAEVSELQKLCPIDLVLGKPPFDVPQCEDDLGTLGFNGDGFLHVVFHVLKTNIERLCGQTNHVFWLLENSGAMTSQYTQHACLSLQGWPAMWNVKGGVQYYWGNIPGLYSSRKKYKVVKFPDEQSTNPAVNKSASHQNQKKMRSRREPVSKAAVRTEEEILESTYEFPPGYTAVGGLSVFRRRELLSRAWDVTVVRQLLRPLREFFKTKECTKT